MERYETMKLIVRYLKNHPDFKGTQTELRKKIEEEYGKSPISASTMSENIGKLEDDEWGGLVQKDKNNRIHWYTFSELPKICKSVLDNLENKGRTKIKLKEAVAKVRKEYRDGNREVPDKEEIKDYLWDEIENRNMEFVRMSSLDESSYNDEEIKFNK